jgi:two-component system, OmpR family, KDP operon response regulator KdpE
VDLGLPDTDGIDLIKSLRVSTRTPVIVLSARSAESDKVTALEAGADDYIAKPFDEAEFLRAYGLPCGVPTEPAADPEYGLAVG